jgi:hypothetical protein
MPTLIVTIASMLGINPLRLIIYTALILAVVTGAIVLRQHYVNEGWAKHKAAVEKQDQRAVDASKKVEEQTDKCSDANGFWDVITQSCKLQEEEKAK